MNKQTIGIMLGRFQPVHKGHIEIIRKMKKKYDKVHIFVGKPLKKTDRNPYDVEEMVKLLISKTSLESNEVSILPDLTHERDNSDDWAFYLKSAIINKSLAYEIHYVYGVKDTKKVKEWFKQEAICPIYLDPMKTSVEISATDVRKIHNEYNDKLATLDALKTHNKRVFIIGTTGVGKTTLINHLALKGHNVDSEFDTSSHNYICSLQTKDFESDKTQHLIAGMKFSHIMSSTATIFERAMIDNIAFFDNNKLHKSYEINNNLQQIIDTNFDNLYIYIDSFEIRKRVSKRGRVNEIYKEALLFYAQLKENYLKVFNYLVNHNAKIMFVSQFNIENTDQLKRIEQTIKQHLGSKNVR